MIIIRRMEEMEPYVLLLEKGEEEIIDRKMPRDPMRMLWLCYFQFQVYTIS